jgi:hypothetical protein
MDTDDSEWKLRRCVSTPPIELRIDLLRELLRLRLADALAWVSCRLCDNDHEVVARELHGAPCTMRPSQ